MRRTRTPMSKRRTLYNGSDDDDDDDVDDDEEMEELATTTPRPRRSISKALEEEAQYATPLKQDEAASRTISEAMKTPKIVKQKQRRRDNDAVYLSAFGIQVPAQKKKWIGKRRSEERDTDSPCTKRMISMLSTVSLNTPPPLKKVKKNLALETNKEIVTIPNDFDDEEEDDDFLSYEDWDDDGNDNDDERDEIEKEIERVCADDDDGDSFKEFQRRKGKGSFAMSTPSPVKKSPHRAFLMRQSTPESGRARVNRGGCFISPISSATATPIAGHGGKERKKKYTKEIRDKYDNYLLEMSFSTSGDGNFPTIDEWYEKIYKKNS